MLKISPINNLSFQNKHKKNEKYKDPLMRWPARGLAYTNELGAVISDIAPQLGTLLWFPAMLYFGADIYDKYKNEKTSYFPDAERGTKQAIFQLLASVILPTASVIGGQMIASSLGVFGKSELSLQSREETINFLQEFMSRRHLNKYNESNYAAFKDHFVESLSTKHENLVREHKIKNPFVFLKDALFARRHPESLAVSHKEKVLKYADENIDEMFEIYKNLTLDKKPKQFSDKLWNKFGKLKTKYAKDPDYKENYLRDAAEDIIKKYQKSKIMKGKMLKTIGGFVALGLAIKPIDEFVENVIIKKVVQPNLQNVFTKNEVEQKKNKILG